MTDTHIKINAVTPRVQYTGNGVTTVFPYEFAIFDESDMVVYLGDEVQESGYSVSGAGQTEGGNVTFDTAPDDGVVITLYRNIPIERITDFQEGGTFRPKNLNDEFDRQTAFLQQVNEALSRSVKVDVTSGTNPEEILPKIEDLYDDIDNIDAVAGDLANIDDVATNLGDIDNCVNNMAAIQDAPNQASAAAGSANDASGYATAAANSASAAALSAASCMPILFDFKWSDHEISNMAWLRADTYSWQDGTVYTNAYNHLVADISGKTATTETIDGTTITYYLADDGHKIVDVANVNAIETVFSSTGVAWYYVIDTANQRFKLPRTKYGITGFSDAVGKYVAPGLPNITGSFRFSDDNDTNAGIRVANTDGCFYGVSSSQSVCSASGSSTQNVSSYVYQDASRSSSIYGNGSTVQPPATQMYLYFYVGQFSQSATEQTAGLNASLFNGKVDLDAGNINATGKYNILTYALANLQESDSSKIGYIYQVTVENTTISAPSGGKWLVLNCYYINNNTAAMYRFLDDNYMPGNIVSGGTQILRARSGYQTVVALIKVE